MPDICPVCKAEPSHVLYQVGGVYVCESCWVLAHPMLEGSGGHSVAHAQIPRRAKQDSDSLSAVERGAYRR